MRDWAKGKARPATTPEVAEVVTLKTGRALDL